MGVPDFPSHTGPAPEPGGTGRAAAHKVMAVASGGGHWVEMSRILPAFEGCDMVYVSTDAEAGIDLGPAPYYAVQNFTRRNLPALWHTVRQVHRILRRERPEVIVTTGAAPGLVGLALGKLLFGSRTVWIDSIAAWERMSLSGRLARFVADVWLVQWQHLARPGGPKFWGAIL